MLIQALRQTGRQDFVAGGVKNHKGTTSFKYNIGCTQQPGCQTWNGCTDFKWGTHTTTGLPSGEGPALHI